MKQICSHNPPKCRPGEAFDHKQDCRNCWLMVHDKKWNLAHGGDGEVTALKQPQAPVPIVPAQHNDVNTPCRWLGRRIRDEHGNVRQQTCGYG